MYLGLLVRFLFMPVYMIFCDLSRLLHTAVRLKSLTSHKISYNCSIKQKMKYNLAMASLHC